jgi:Co/Zn/Cd efflux system component
MHSQSVARWQHEHAFLGKKHDVHERRTWAVVALATVMMITEIVGGWLFGSMALMADGLHMSTHVAALSIAAVAYSIARKHMLNDWFSFGTGKLGELAAFASAIILAMVALLIGYESVTRLVSPVTIHFGEAIPVAALGLAVNLFSAWLLRDHDHHHDHDHEDEEEEGRSHYENDHAHHMDHKFSCCLHSRSGRRGYVDLGHLRSRGGLVFWLGLARSGRRPRRHRRDRRLGMEPDQVIGRGVVGRRAGPRTRRADPATFWSTGGLINDLNVCPCGYSLIKSDLTNVLRW